MRAFLMVRDAPWYRRDAFEKGLRAAGYDVLRQPDKARPGDVLVQWNRYSTNHAQAEAFERAGGTVIVCENGYIGKNGVSPKFDVHPRGPRADSYYAIGLGYHNDHTRVLPGGPSRWESMGIELKPWRTAGEHILVCPNRSFGVADRVMHPDWAQRCAERLRKATRRPVRVRGHPGNDAPQRPLSEDLRGAWACVVWSSTCAVHALAEGIPAYIEAPYQILKGASATGPVDAPECPDRLPHFERLAWAQWQLQEIESGAPFRLLATAGCAVAAA